MSKAIIQDEVGADLKDPGHDHGRIQTIDHEEMLEGDLYGNNGVVHSDYGDEDGHDGDDLGDKVEVNLDELEDEDSDQESLLGRGNDGSGSTGESGGTSTSLNKFAVKESNDKGLADMETGSEVYMSELLVSLHAFA